MLCRGLEFIRKQMDQIRLECVRACVAACVRPCACVCACVCVSIPNASVVRKKLIIRYNDEQVCDASYYGPTTSIGLKLRQ